MWTASAGTISFASVCLFLRNTLGNPLGPIRNENFSLVELVLIVLGFEAPVLKKSHCLIGCTEFRTGFFFN